MNNTRLLKVTGFASEQAKIWVKGQMVPCPPSSNGPEKGLGGTHRLTKRQERKKEFKSVVGIIYPLDVNRVNIFAKIWRGEGNCPPPTPT